MIDSKKNSGLGKVLQKNIQIYYDTLEWFVAAIKHGNGSDWWIITRKLNILNLSANNEYLKFLMTPNNIIGPDTQAIGTPSNCVTNCAPSEDGKKILLASGCSLI